MTFAPDSKEEAIREGLFVCYECRDGRCAHCIGVPCMCPCEWPKEAPPEDYSI